MFVAVGMIWSGARSFHGRPVHWSGMIFGSVFWAAASFFPAFAGSAASRMVVGALIIAGYSTLTAAELRRERRKSLIHRWPAAFGPILHGAMFLVSRRVGHTVLHGRGGPERGAQLDRSLCRRNPTLRCWNGSDRAGADQGSCGESLQNGGSERSTDRAVEPARIL